MDYKPRSHLQSYKSIIHSLQQHDKQDEKSTTTATTTIPVALLILITAASIILLATLNIAYAQDDLLTVTYIDQETEGESTLIIFPNDDVLLIDGGVKSGFREHVVPVLEHHGITTIDLVIITHKDQDHLNGINALLGDGTHVASEIWFSPPVNNNSRTNELFGHIERLNTPLLYPTTGHTKTFGDITIEVLYPQRQLQFNDDNENSIVTLLEYGELEFLFTGDIESDAEAFILDNVASDKLNIDIMNAPHHGSESSSTVEFVEATSPALVIYGAHDRNDGKDKHDNPDDSVIARYDAINSRQLQTGTSDNIVIQTNGNGCTLTLENGTVDACFAGIMTVEESNIVQPTLVLNSIPDQIIDEGSQLSFTATTSVTTTLTFSLIGIVPTGASITPAGIFVWTPTESQHGTHIITIQASDGTITNTTSVSVLVNEVNVKPVLVDPGSHTTNAQSSLSITLSATDTDVPANVLTYNHNHTHGIIIDNIYTWASPTVGTYHIAFTVSDGNGGIDTQVAIVNVDDGNGENGEDDMNQSTRVCR